MLAYKFLRPGAIGPFSGFAWPAGRWVAADTDVTRCRTGIHACRAADLPWWLQDELWVAELAEPVVEASRKVVASRARLVERVAAWDAETSQAFADACARRAREHAAHALDRERVEQMASDGASRAACGHTATAAYIAAHAARHAGGASAMAAERRFQSGWLVARLGLAG